MSILNPRLRDASARAAVFAVILLTAFYTASAHAANLVGEWRGAYAYMDAQPPVPFTLKLTQNDKTISGREVELATFGDGTSRYLSARISGTSDGGNVAFTKVYDGTGGQTHSVQYTGTVSSDGSVMSGSWSLGETKGSWRVILNSGL
jgi:hypothetical protein